MFYAEIQNGHQKLHENDFWEKSPVDSADNLRVKNFVEIALSCPVSEITAFLRLTQKFKMAAKSGWKTKFAKVASSPADTLWVKNFVKIARSRFDFQDKQVSAFNTEIQDGRQKSDNLCFKNFVKIALSCSVSEINTFLCLTQKFK